MMKRGTAVHCVSCHVSAIYLCQLMADVTHQTFIVWCQRFMDETLYQRLIRWFINVLSTLMEWNNHIELIVRFICFIHHSSLDGRMISFDVAAATWTNDPSIEIDGPTKWLFVGDASDRTMHPWAVGPFYTRIRLMKETLEPSERKEHKMLGSNLFLYSCNC